MVLKRLELQGFKSFADKVVLEFEPGITAIIGPNGSGKSNVTDALRWVLGEQSPKALRGQRTEDMIFAGSDCRRQVDTAEVSVVLDNRDGTLPVQREEFRVTRRAYRSGETECFLNRVPQRLKDLHELLYDTGVGRDSYSIVGQGRIEEMLNARPEERRILFEEAAGIVKYRNRKKESVRKLEDTRQNLLRIRDVLAELGRQLGPLAEQAARAEMYRQLEDELRDHEIALYAEEIGSARRDLAASAAEEARFRDELAQVSAAMEELEAEASRIQTQLGHIDGVLRAAQEEVYTYGTELERCRARREATRERLAAVRGQANRVASAAAQIEVKRRQLLDDLGVEEERLAVVVSELDRSKELARAKEDELVAVDTDVAALERAAEEAKGEVIELLNRLAGAKNQSAASAASADNAGRILARLDVDLERAVGRLGELEKAIGQAVEHVVLAQKERQELEEEIASLEGLRAAGRARGRSLEDRRRELGDLVAAVSSRLRVQEEMWQECEWYRDGVRSVFRAVRAGKLEGVSVEGVVGELLETSAPYERAIEAALGSSLEDIVVAGERDVGAALAYLRAEEAGRATFVALELAGKVEATGWVDLGRAEGVVGSALELVRFNPRYRGIMDCLLGRVFVVRTLADALRLAREAGGTVRLVTLEGEVVQSGCSVSGGSSGGSRSTMLGRARNVEELRAELGARQGELQEVTAELEAARAELEEVEGRLSRARDCLARAIAGHRAAQNELGRLQHEKSRVEAGAGLMRQERAARWDEMGEAERKRDELRRQVDSLERASAAARRLVSERQEELVQARARRVPLAEEVTALKVRVASLEQEVIRLRETVSRLREAADSATAELRQRQEEMASLEAEAGENGRAGEELGRALEGLSAKASAAGARLAEAKAERDSLAEAAEANEKRLRQLRRSASECQGRLHDAEVRRNRAEVEMAGLASRLRAEYGLSPEDVVSRKKEGLDVAWARGRVAELRTRMKSLGLVNLAAVEEHRKVRERYDFLRQQHADLERARDSLYRVIAAIDGVMKKRFAETVTAVDEEFGRVFRRLFRGGTARLVLTDEQNMLETGVDIVVQLPGKKLQNLSLLSGGEKALVAIALVFAIIKVRPSPFCVFDEIETSLDEANLVRFGEFLKELSERTQFVVMTHRKATMEVADALYGVTMEESGVSKLVSVRLAERAG